VIDPSKLSAVIFNLAKLDKSFFEVRFDDHFQGFNEIKNEFCFFFITMVKSRPGVQFFSELIGTAPIILTITGKNICCKGLMSK